MEIQRKIRLVTDLTEVGEIIKLLIQAADNTEHPLQTFRIPQELRFVNKTYTDLYSFIRFDEKTQHNVYGNCTSDIKKWEYLIGILDVNKSLGCFELKDNLSKIPVKIIRNSGHLYKLKKALVLIKKWKVFTEIFQLDMSETLEFILVNVEDVHIIKSLGEEKLYYMKDEVCNIQGIHSYFEVIRKTEVIIGFNGKPEVWIEAALSENTLPITERRRVYAILHSVDMNPFIREKMVYKLTYEEIPKALPIMCNKELFGLRDIKELFSLNKTIFQETDIPPHFNKNEITFFNLKHVKDFMKRCGEKQAFSFILQITRKQLQVTRYKSWFPMRHDKLAYFGNPGKEHQMRLIFTDSDSGFLDLYLNNRDNHVTPLGLIPDMVVKVKNVNVNKGKYLRSNLFTSFQIIDYSPKLEYSSANLLMHSLGSWRWKTTQSTSFELYFDLPTDCIVHSSFIFVAVYDLNISPVCFDCQKSVIASRPCSSCKQSERDLNVEITIHAQGPTSSVARVGFNIDSDKEFLFSLLGLNKTKEVRYFCNAFFKSDGLRVDFCKLSNFNTDSFTTDARSKDFLERLVDLIYKDINFKLYSLVDAVCVRKFEKNPWQMLDFEMVHNSSIYDPS